MDLGEVFGKRLLKLREERGETQEQLAKAIGITRQSLSRYETNERTPNIELIYNIAKHYEISADYLLGLSEIKAVDSDIQATIKYTHLSEEALKRWNNNNEAEKAGAHERLKKAPNHLISDSQTNYEYTLNKLLQFGYFYDLLEDLYELSWQTDDYRYVDSKVSAIKTLGTDRFLKIKDTSDLLRYRVLKSIEKISDEFDGRENIGEHNGKQE